MSAGAQLGAYRLIRRIGAGGMAEVFLAERIGAAGFSRTVALKSILTHGADEEAVQLFLDEARVASLLHHANIVETVDLGYEHSTLFIVMEYVPGPSLSRLIHDLKRAKRYLPTEAVAFIGAKVASALHYAWGRATTPDGSPLHMVHRDISPQNIMITRGGLVKLTDFGVARASIQTHRTRTGQVRGKAMYMAPEQVRAKPLDGRTDVFGLCLVLYEALTRRRAYQRKTDIDSMRAILTDPVEPIRSLNPQVPPALEQAIMRGLAKKPDDRWQSAGELQTALEAIYRGRSETRLEHVLSGIVFELFGGMETYADDNAPPLEGWQPTVADGKGLGPQRLDDRQISTRIANLLHDSASDLALPAATGSSEPMVLKFTDTASDHPIREDLSTPSATQPGGVLRSPGGPTPPSLPSTTAPSAVGSATFSEPDLNARTPSGSTPSLRIRQRTGPPAFIQVGVPVLTVLAVVAGLTLARPRATEAPAVSVEPSSPKATATPAPRVKARPASVAPPPIAEADDEPAPAAPKPITAAPKPDRSGRASPDRRLRTRERAAPAHSPRPTASFQQRVYAARQAYEARGDKAMVAKLNRLLLDVSLRDPSEAERGLLERAERALR